MRLGWMFPAVGALALKALTQQPLPCTPFGEPRCTRTPTPVSSPIQPSPTVPPTATPTAAPTFVIPTPAGGSPTPTPGDLVGRLRGITITGFKRSDFLWRGDGTLLGAPAGTRLEPGSRCRSDLNGRMGPAIRRT